MEVGRCINRPSKLRVYPYLNIPKEVLTVNEHEIDGSCVFGAYLANPYLSISRRIQTIKEHEIYTIYSFLRDNKVLLRVLNYCFSSRPYSSEKKRFIEKLAEKYEQFAEAYELAFMLRHEIRRIAKTLTEKGVKIVFIKASTEFPLDSDNFDILVKKQDLEKTRKILEKLGFTELRKLREYEWLGPPHKFLYRQLNNGMVLSIHLHSQVAWGGLKFVDENRLWERHVEAEIDGVRLSYPTPDDHLLITVAHAFFENKCLKLSDLMHVVEDLHSVHDIEWNYIADCAMDNHWFGSFYAALRLMDHIYESIFSRKLVEEGIYEKLRKRVQIRKVSSLDEKMISLFDRKPTLPFRLPKNTIVMAFLKKVFATEQVSFIEKIKKILFTSCSYMRRRLSAHLRYEIPGFLVCFSGQDGSGKTTHSKLLISELVQRKIRTDYVWSRGVGFIIQPFLRLGRSMILGERLSHTNKYTSKRKILLSKKPIRTIWTLALLVNEILITLVKVKIPLLTGRVVICDRYINDILVDVKCELGYDVGWVIEKCIKKLVPKPRIHFLFDAKPPRIMRRKKDLNLEVVKCKRYQYLLLSNADKLTVINTNKMIRQNREEILSLFMKARYLGKNR